MNVLGKELSEKFDRLYDSVLKATDKPIEFRPMWSQRYLPPKSRRGYTRTEDDIRVIYLDTDLANEEFELTAVHELCHVLLRSQGIGVDWLEQPMPEHLARQLRDEVATLTDCFVHVAVNRCMKSHSYDITGHDDSRLRKLREFMRQRQPINKSGLSLHAAFYISHICCLKYGYPSINVDEMTKLYKQWQPEVVDLAERLIQHIPDVDLTTATGCYQATKALRDGIGKELKVDVGWLKFRNPQTGQPE